MKHFLWNMVANIKNGQKSKKKYIFFPKKKTCALMLNILWSEGFILGYKIINKNSNVLKIFLKYKNEKTVIKYLTSITKPGKKIYCSSKQLWKISPNLGLLILSTNRGILTSKDCKKLNIGGELFFIVK